MGAVYTNGTPLVCEVKVWNMHLPIVAQGGYIIISGPRAHCAVKSVR
jgi:hypothetical protein